MEESLQKFAPDDFALDDDGKEVRGRVDIRYATNSGKHIIVELKRYRRSVDQLIENAQKQYSEYLDASAKARELEALLGAIGEIDLDS